MASVSYSIKTGSTFAFSGAATNDDGSAFDLTGYVIDMDIVSKDGTVLFNGSSTSNITITDAAGGLFRTADTATDNWPIEIIDFDLKYTNASSFASHSETAILSIDTGRSQ